MLKHSLFVRLEAKPGKADEVAAFLQQGLQMANQETTTPLWFALRLGPTTFAIFDSFNDESGRQAHLNGPIAKALMHRLHQLQREFGFPVAESRRRREQLEGRQPRWMKEEWQATLPGLGKREGEWTED